MDDLDKFVSEQGLAFKVHLLLARLQRRLQRGADEHVIGDEQCSTCRHCDLNSIWGDCTVFPVHVAVRAEHRCGQWESK